MKVCLVSVLPPFRSGVSLYTSGLLSGFDKARPAFPIVVIANKSADATVGAAGQLQIVRAWTRGPHYLFQLISAVTREKPTIIHIQHEFFLHGGLVSSLIFPLLLLLVRLMGIRLIVTMHGVVPRKLADAQFAEAFFIPKNPIAREFGLTFLTWLISTLADVVIVHNNFARTVLHQGYRVSPRKVWVIPHGIGTWNPDESKSSSPHGKTVLFFGNITPSKGLEYLITAFEQIPVPNARLVIAGGPHPRGSHYFSRIAQMARSTLAPQKIALTGYISEQRIHALFEQCDVAVLPYTYAVSSSGALALALQHRKPVVVTALPAFEEIITDERNGLVVPPRDPSALAEAIERLLLNDELKHLLSHGISESCSHLAWPKIAARTCECYYKTESGACLS